MSKATSPLHPLSGVRVLDLSTVIFGPYASMILADYGAEVIKVESPEGDPTRNIGPRREAGMSAAFLGANRNKFSVVLDLKSEQGREAMRALVRSSDVLIHNIRAAKLAPLGLESSELREVNPKLIYVSLNGFGEGGAYAGKPAYDDIIQGLCGMADLSLRRAESPQYFPTVAADKTGALIAAHAILAALFQRSRTGLGQVVEVPMFESAVSFLLVEHFHARHMPETAARAGYNRLLAASRRPFRTLDGLISMMPYSNAHWRGFFLASGRCEFVDDPRFASLSLRTKNIDALYDIAASILLTQSTAFWISKLEPLDIPIARINSLDELEQDEHLKDVGLFADADDGKGQPYRLVRSPVRMNGLDVPPTCPPRLGEHTEGILGRLGLRDETLRHILAQVPAVDSMKA